MVDETPRPNTDRECTSGGNDPLQLVEPKQVHFLRKVREHRVREDVLELVVGEGQGRLRIVPNEAAPAVAGSAEIEQCGGVVRTGQPTMIDVPQKESNDAPIPAAKVKNCLRIPKSTDVPLVELPKEEVDGEPLDERVIARPEGP